MADIERYLMGSCHHLAVAMHRMTGWQLAAIAGRHQGKEAVLHVVCVDPDGKGWDARGATSVHDLICEQGEEAWAIRLDEADIWTLSQGQGAQLNPIHQTFVVDAADCIDEILDGTGAVSGDAWSPRDPASVEDARSGRRPPPPLGREFAFDPEPIPVPTR